MATTRPIALVGSHYLPHRHTLYVNISPHVCKGLEAIWAYIACALLGWLAYLAAVIKKHLIIVLFIRYEKSFGF